VIRDKAQFDQEYSEALRRICEHWVMQLDCGDALAPHGFAALDDLARSLQVVRTFHGHHRDDLSQEYAGKRESTRFDAKGVNFCAIKNGLGEHVLEGELGW